MITLLIWRLCKDSNIRQKAKVSMFPVAKHSYCCVWEGNHRACPAAQNGFKYEVRFSVPFPESDCGSVHVPQIHSSRCACLHALFFVYVPVCVWRGPIVQASDMRLRDVSGRRGFNRAGQNIINHGWLVDTHVT